jgi:putative nucleotidyltransferase with HDIG domain
MRMPGMNGAQLLNQVMKRYPRTIRLILSGYADEEAVMKCIGATHQYLAKPFDASNLKATLHRIRSLHQLLQGESIRTLITRLDHLPSPPKVYFRVLETLESPACSAQDIGEIIATDPALTAKLLQLVNSAFFGYATSVTSPAEAVQVLGVGTIRSLVLSVHLFSAFDEKALPDLSVEQVWQHSLETGLSARDFIQMETGSLQEAEIAFTAGLLHDIGKLILATNLPMPYRQVLQQARESQTPLSTVEDRTFQAGHAEVGAYLLGLWGLPTPLVETVALHHQPSKLAPESFGPLMAVHVANVLSYEDSQDHLGLPIPVLDQERLRQLGVLHRLDAWRQARKARRG